MQREIPKAQGSASLPRHLLWLLGYEQGGGKDMPHKVTWRDKGTAGTGLLKGQAICFTSLAPLQEAFVIYVFGLALGFGGKGEGK